MGKFDSKNKGGSSSVYELLAQRNQAASARPGQQPRENIPGQNRPQSGGAYPRQSAPAQDQGYPRQNAYPQQGQGYPRQNAYPQQNYPTQPQEAPRRRGPRLGGVIFYTLYFLFIFVFFVGVYGVLSWMTDWLVNFEGAQPTYKRDELFAQYFADPDWGELYDLAQIEDSEYEGKDAFVAYMEERIGDQELTWMETSAGLSGGKKYIVKLGEERIGYFTMTGEEASIADIGKSIADGTSALPTWDLGEIELYYTRDKSFRIEKMDGHTAYVNGVALSDDFTIQTASTIAEEYLPMGVKGIRTCVQEVGGLMCVPTVTITDEAGNAMEVTYDETTGTFTERTEANTIGSEEETVALEATKTYALFMVEKATAAQVGKYFDKNSDIYNTIVKSEIWWTQRNNGAAFADESVTDYCRYSEDLFSVRVSMNLNITRTDGTLKQFPVDTTLFFRWTGSKWLCFEMTNVDVMQPVGEVRLTYMVDGEVISTGFVSNEASEIQTPMVSAPEGKQFAGWALESTDDNGNKTLTIVFGPTDNGVVTLPFGTVLEPMVLHAHFEDIPQGGNG